MDIFADFARDVTAELQRSHSHCAIGISEIRGFGKGWLVLYHAQRLSDTIEPRVAFCTYHNSQVRVVWNYIAGDGR